MEFVTLKDNELVLRTLRPEDVTESYASWLRDPLTSKFILNVDYDLTSLKEYVRGKLTRTDVLFLGVFYNDRHVGNIKFEPVNFSKKTAEMGILIGDKDLRGINLAQRIFTISFNYLKSLGIEQITLGVGHENINAQKAYLKFGFRVYNDTPESIRMIVDLA